MRRPRMRLTVRGMMTATAIIAVDLGLIRAAESVADYNSSLFAVTLSAYALVPSLSLLAVAAASVAVGLVRRGQAPPFSTGYLLLGGLASFGMCLAFAVQAYILFAVIVTVPEPIQADPLWKTRLNDLVGILTLALPQVLPALIGGALAARFGVTIVRNGRDTATDDAAGVPSAFKAE